MKYQYNKPIVNREDMATVEVTVPSGNVFLMLQPSKYSLMFSLDAMPAALTEKAIKAWKEQGVGNEEELEQAIGETPQRDMKKLVAMGFKIRDKVLEMSVAPKIVLYPTGTEGEVCVDDISDKDLDFLFLWVATGGKASPGLVSFREGPEQDSLASASRKTKRSKAVTAGGTE